jgi:hypothetical protein
MRPGYALATKFWRDQAADFAVNSVFQLGFQDSGLTQML